MSNTMECYTSDSSDSDGASNKLLDLGYMSLDVESLQYNVDALIADAKQTIDDIETLQLHHNALVTLPDALFRFTHLRVLDLSANRLRALPDVFRHLQLTTLICRGNHLTNESLAKTFTRNTTLRELNLSGNRLTTFPEQVFDLVNLKYLYLGANKIDAIPRNIGQMRSLLVLSMGGNELREVPVHVGQLRSLHALILCDNHIESIPANIANLKNLKTLALHKNQLRTLPLDIIALSNLTELSLRDNPLVVRFVSDMTNNPASLLELSARAIKLYDTHIEFGQIPNKLFDYLQSAHRCVNPNCKGVFFDNRVEHVKFVDFCGKYRIPLLQYLCSSKCAEGGSEEVQPPPTPSYMMRKVLLG